MAQIRIQQLPARQRLRKALLLISFLLFPVTLYYFSPALILNGAAEGVVNGSMLVFVGMFVGALCVGRLWCGWACPAGGLQEQVTAVNNRRTSGRINWIKWAIWIPWVGLIATLAIRAGGYSRIEPLFNLEGGVTLAIPVDEGGPPWYMIYYIIVALFTLLPLAVGRRAACHTVCWMAPFMILGRRLRNLVGWPSLRLHAEADKCIDCLRCTSECPMSLDVNGMVRAGDMEHSECILCATCADICPKNVIHMRFGAG
ncbi:MAG: 4Fe-4S binding protein [Anaerolineae bacterium]|nr:4Fe-4S binding protein [Anaerolineae bacterium]